MRPVETRVPVVPAADSGIWLTGVGVAPQLGAAANPFGETMPVVEVTLLTPGASVRYRGELRPVLST